MDSPRPRRTTLITGASRGLGAAIALAQGAAGSNVAINYFNSHDAAEQLCQRIRQTGGHARAFKADARSEAEIVRLIREVADVFGGIDVLVANATGPQPFLSIEEQTWSSYLDQLEFFVKSPLLLLKQVLPGMKERGFGRIINIGSEVFELGNPRFALRPVMPEQSRCPFLACFAVPSTSTIAIRQRIERPITSLWEFSFQRCEMFVVGASPTYCHRRSRNLGPGIVLIFQPRPLFIDPATSLPIAAPVRHRIHQRMLAYDGMPVHPDIGFYGNPINREWKTVRTPGR